MNCEKTLSEMQNEVDSWVSKFETPYFSPLSGMAAMTEEVGEIARVLNRMYGDKKEKSGEVLNDLEEELGDLLFSLVCMANSQGIDLSKAYERNMDKNLKRDNNRFKMKNGV